MGGSVSAGVDNDDLIDNLLAEDYIKTPSVEKVFRAVDRGMYFTPLEMKSAYKDLAWKIGNIHLSAPCIYCEVMENLDLAPGMSFLNLGSGTGYLSTMAGLILGPYGVNHGIEIHDDVIQYAHEKLEEFMKTAAAIEEYGFCEPKFVQGNCLQLDACTMRYDRVYCGASCPASYENYMKSLIKVGGILVIPLKDRLLRIRRVSEKVWDTRFVLPVAFANLVEPTAPANVILPTTEPISLMDTCRTTIRSILKAAVDHENPELVAQPKNKARKRTLPRLLFPMFEREESERVVVFPNHQHQNRDVELDSDDLSVVRIGLNIYDGTSSSRSSSDEVIENPVEHTSRYRTRRRVMDVLDTDSESSSDSCSSYGVTRYYQVRQALIHAATTRAVASLNSSPAMDPTHAVSPSGLPSISTVSNISTPSDSSDSSDSLMDVEEIHPSGSEIKSDIVRERAKRKEADMRNNDPTPSTGSVRKLSDLQGSNMNSDLSSSENKKKRGVKREKVDSGIGEDMGPLGNRDQRSDEDSDSEEEGTTYKPTLKDPRRLRRGRVGQRKERKQISLPPKISQLKGNAFTACMRSKIQQLPLPYSLKSYINFYRDL